LKTVLEKCGANKEFVQKLLKEGLFVPRRIQEYPKPLHPSHAHPALCDLEKSIPRFTEKEKEMYINEPYKFYLDALKATEFATWVAGELIDIVPDIKTIGVLEERIAASLSLIRIFFANYDFNYLKYDRDIEYSEFEESITGYFWQKASRLCKLAFGENGEERFLVIITGTPFVYKTIKYNLAKVAIKKKLSQHFDLIDIDDEKASSILKRLAVKDNELYSEILWIADHFYKYPKDFIKESISEKGGVNLDRLIKLKKQGQEYFLEAYNILISKNFVWAEELNDAYRAIEVIMRLNEKTGFIVRGKTPQGNGYFYNDSLFVLFDIIKRAIADNPEFIKKNKLDIVQNILKKVEEMKIIGVTPGIKYFLMEFEKQRFFSDKINSMYDSELRRWFTS
jgi:hypothetical protein